MEPDLRQDCEAFDFALSEDGMSLEFTFERRFDTCDDAEDYVIEVIQVEVVVC